MVRQGVSPRYENAGNDALLSRLPPRARSALDLGCGAGGNARLLTARGIAVDAVTLRQDEAREVAGSCRRTIIHDLELGLPSGLEPYDAVVCSHVLEHLRDPGPLLTDIRDLLGPGRLLVALPNIAHWRERLRLLGGRFDYDPRGGIMDATHLRWFTFRSGRQLLERYGLRVLDAWVEADLPCGPLRPLWPAAASALDRASGALRPGLFGHQLLYLAAR